MIGLHQVAVWVICSTARKYNKWDTEIPCGKKLLLLQLFIFWCSLLYPAVHDSVLTFIPHTTSPKAVFLKLFHIKDPLISTNNTTHPHLIIALASNVLLQSVWNQWPKPSFSHSVTYGYNYRGNTVNHPLFSIHESIKSFLSSCHSDKIYI